MPHRGISRDPAEAIRTAAFYAYGKLTKGSRRSEEHTSELQSHVNLVCRLLLEKKKIFSGGRAVKFLQRLPRSALVRHERCVADMEFANRSGRAAVTDIDVPRSRRGGDTAQVAA